MQVVLAAVSPDALLVEEVLVTRLPCVVGVQPHHHGIRVSCMGEFPRPDATAAGMPRGGIRPITAGDVGVRRGTRQLGPGIGP